MRELETDTEENEEESRTGEKNKIKHEFSEFLVIVIIVSLTCFLMIGLML